MATCNPGGAGKWRDDYSAALRGADVIICPDADEAGEDHLATVALALTGVASRIRVLKFNPAADWITAGGTIDQLWQLADVAPEWMAPSSPNDDKTFTLEEWLARDLPEPDFVLGELLSTTTRMLITGPTGLGKTIFGLAVAIALVTNKGFLRWIARRKARVLYVDGEMSARAMKRRLADAVRRAGVNPHGLPLVVLSREDHEDMPPLNTPAGQKWLDAWIEKRGLFDLIIFDNIQALLVGDMKDEEQWAGILPWVRSLTRRSIGQIWFHHTGHDEGKSYGSKAREWQLDTTVLMERVKDPETDLAFTLKFTKARERTPDNRDQFEAVTLRLVNDRWLERPVEGTKGTRLTENKKLVRSALKRAVAEAGAAPPTNNHIPDHTPTVSEDLWRKYAMQMGLASDAEPKTRNQTFSRAAMALVNDGLVGRWGDQCWLI